MIISLTLFYKNYNKNSTLNILKYKNLNNINHTRSTKCQYSTIHVKNMSFILLNWLLIIFKVAIKIKNTPKETWLKCNISILNKLVQKEFVLIVNDSNENSHNWFHINRNPVIKLKKQNIRLQYILL